MNKEKMFKKSRNSIFFGNYPNKLVHDFELVQELNKNVNLPTNDNLNGWTKYVEYTEGLSVMYYIDIIFEQKKYRAVYFNQYADANMKINNDKYWFNSDHIYWFEYEPIEWIIAYSDDNHYYLRTKNIIDAHKTDRCDYYYRSELRQYLNSIFLNFAFTKEEIDILDNTFGDMRFNYVDVKDIITLPDWEALRDIDNDKYLKYAHCLYFHDAVNTELEREFVSTDYARIRGIVREKFWSLAIDENKFKDSLLMSFGTETLYEPLPIGGIIPFICIKK